MLDDVITLANINSSSSNREGLERVCGWFAKAFDILKPDTMKQLPLTNGPALLLSKRSDAPIQVFLGGHLDTVFPITSPFQHAQQLDRERLNGPGVADMKGGLVVLLHGLGAFEASAAAEQIGWRIFLNPDEEMGSPYSATHLQTFAKGVDFGLIFEPTLPDGSYVSARKGSTTYKISSFGKQAHLGRSPEQGKCAITPLVSLLDQISKLHAPKKGIVIGIGKIQGGTATNVVADRAEAWINIRCWEEKEIRKINQKLHKLIEQYGLVLECHTSRPPKPLTSSTDALFKALATVSDQPIKLEKTGGVCDGNLLAAIGIPTIDTMGVIGGNLHTADEYVMIDSLEQKSRLLTQFLLHVAEKGCHEFSCRLTHH